MARLQLLVALCMTFNLALPSAAETWMTSYHETFAESCPKDELIGGLKSVHSNRKEDRVWNITCRPPKTDFTILPAHCKWSDFLNDFDKEIRFICPNNGAIAGIAGVYDGSYYDRRFKVYCCKLWNDFQGLFSVQSYLHDSQVIDYQNSLDGPLDYRVPYGRVLTGLYSYHIDAYEDRAFGFFTAVPHITTM